MNEMASARQNDELGDFTFEVPFTGCTIKLCVRKPLLRPRGLDVHVLLKFKGTWRIAGGIFISEELFNAGHKG